MEQNQFRIGGVYRARDGRVIRINRVEEDGTAWCASFKGAGIWHPCGARQISDGSFFGNPHYSGNLIPGEVTERGEPVKSAPIVPSHIADAILAAYEDSKGPVLVINKAEPKRAPLDWNKPASSDRLPGFVTVSSTTEQPRERFFCDSPDMLPASHQVAPGFGSALLKV